MTPEELEALKASNQKAYDSYMALKGENDKLKAKPDPKDDPKPDPKDEKDLADKARLEREEAEKKGKYEKSLEGALNFNIAGPQFLKDNVGLLPKNVESIFAAADKEKYDSAIDKANAIKSGVVSEFFAVQENHDLLTASQKSELDEFLKLTKNGKQERVESIYAMIFEPTLETKRKVQKAKELNNGSKNQTDSEKALAERMMKLSKKHYLGDKE